jgi:hypothetical protein
MEMTQVTNRGLVKGLVAECVVNLVCPGTLYPCQDFLVWHVLDLGDVVVAGVVLEDDSLDQVLATS